eukprot:TRINITY_DN75632_c0_g1_i1.p1 TRINITY_DN75632_c0_g1~~TRINITY_DN75632_c0_g1_i1.p1  ORF type:complete len:417 (+),score=57.94 TRINITY_DN75632_c0_g1_i1:827-2077(+)
MFKRGSLQQFQRAKPIKVHTPLPLPYKLPLAVHALLSKSEKLCPSSGVPSWTYFCGKVDLFFKTVERKAAISAFEDNGIDPLSKLRRPWFKPTSNWEPPCLSENVNFKEYMFDTKTRLFNRFAAYRAKQLEDKKKRTDNMSFADKWAIAWLRSKADEIVDLQTDKNLGTAVITCQQYDDFADGALHASFEQIPEDTVNRILRETKFNINDAVAFAKDFQLMSPKLEAYFKALHEDYRIPLLRLLLKVHKLIPEVRALTACTKWITNPIAIYLARVFGEIVDRDSNIAKDTLDVIDTVSQIHGNDLAIATVDVDKLYPSIDLTQCEYAVKQACIEHFHGQPGWGARVEWLSRLLHIIFASQIVKFTALSPERRVASGTQWFKQTRGVTTGMPCATQVANIFLRGLDAVFRRCLGRAL